MKPDKRLRKKYHTDYPDLTEFASRARLLQSIWRDEKKFIFEDYGNLLNEDFAKKSGKNFLTKHIFDIVKDEVKNKYKLGKVIKEPRIWNNLLSSQPLAFNLFGELKLNTGIATKVFQDIFPERNIKIINTIEFEYSPGRGDPKYTGDKSAFDVFIEYVSKDNKSGFLGIEVKYAEDLNDKPSTHKSIYESISQKSKIFNLAKLEDLKKKPIQQIWRDHLLALSLFITNQDYAIGDFVYLYPSGNINCLKGIEKYKLTFSKVKEKHFKPLTIEELIKKLKKYSRENWINEFEYRYLKFDKIINL